MKRKEDSVTSVYENIKYCLWDPPPQHCKKTLAQKKTSRPNNPLLAFFLRNPMHGRLLNQKLIPMKLCFVYTQTPDSSIHHGFKRSPVFISLFQKLFSVVDICSPFFIALRRICRQEDNGGGIYGFPLWTQTSNSVMFHQLPCFEENRTRLL